MTDKSLDFLTMLENANESERDWLIMEMSLQSLSETLRQAIWAAAIPHWFDYDFLNAILGFPLKDSDFKTLTELSFIEVFPERGFNVHERSRKLLLDNLWTTNKARFQKLSKHAAAYCKKQDQNDTSWCVETLYHGLLANNLTAKDGFISQGFEWLNSFQYEKLEKLTQIILDSRFVTSEILSWGEFFKAEVDYYYSRFSLVQNSLHQVLKYSNNNFLIASSFQSLGLVYGQLGKHIEAQNFILKALNIFQKIKNYVGEANCIRILGNIHLSLAEYAQAKKLLQKALSMYKRMKEPVGEANCIRSLGDVHLSLAEYDQAQKYHQQALPIFQHIKAYLSEALCIASLGVIYYKQQQIELAIVTLQQAAQLYEKFANKRGKASCFDDLATIYRWQKQFNQALSSFNQAIDIYPDETIWYQNRANLYMQIGDYEKAEVDIKHAETMGGNPAGTLLRKAELALWQQQTLQAVELSQQALAQRPADGNFRAFFALTLLANGQTEQANNEMQQALTAIYQPHDFADLLENIDKLIRIYGDRAEFATMRELIVTARKQPNEE